NIEDAKKAGYLKGEFWARKFASSALVIKGEYESGKRQLTESYNLAIQMGDSAYISDYYSGLGHYYGVQSKYDSSAIFYKKAIAIDEALGRENMSYTYGNLAIAYQMQSDFPNAIFYQQKALKIAENIGNERSQANILVNMGNTYRNIGDSIRSEESFLKAIELAQKTKEKRVELYAYSNLSDLYYVNGHYDKAYTNSMLAVKLAKETGDIGIGAASLSKAARCKVKMLEYKEAEELALLSITLADSSNQPLIIYQTRSE